MMCIRDRRYIQKYGFSYECCSDNNQELMKIFHSECENNKTMHDVGRIFSYLNEYPIELENTQLELLW